MKAHLQIVIPAYNEASRIGATIENLMAELSKRTEHIQVLVVLNGCKDDTLEVVESYRKLYPDKIIVQDHREPLGKGRAIIHGFKMCTAEYVSFMDADGSVSASSVLSLLDRIGQYDAAIGSRRCDGAKILVKQPWPRHVAGRAYAWLTRLLLGLPFCDTQCGGKIFKKEVADVIASNCTEYGWAFDVAMLDIILLKGFTVKELPIIWTNDDRSKIKLFKDGFQMLKSLLRLRYSKRTVEYKNVLMLQHHFINQGTYKRCYKFAEHLASRARHISIVCVDTKMNGFWPKIEYVESQPYISLIKVPLFMGTNNPISILLRIGITSLWLSSKKQYDLIHLFALGHPFNAAVSTILWLTRRGKKIAMDWDDLWGDGYGLYLGSFINKILKAQEAWLPKIIHPEFMTTASHELYNRSLKIGLPMERVHILINGCDPKKISAHSRSDARHNLSFDSESTYVISIGNTYSEKSFNQMLQAFRLALSKNSKIKLLLLGDFSKFGTLGKIIENIKTENSDLFAKSIITPGLVSLKTMNMYLDASDFAILPMEDTPIDHARFPIRFGDYLSASKLIISNAVGEIARILNEEKIGLVSSPEDAQAFAQNILKAAEHMKTDNNFLFKMQQIQTKYSWKTLSIKLDTLYNKSLGTQYDETVEIKRAA